MRAAYSPYRLIFKFNAGTSRGVLTYKDTYFIKVWEENEPECFGIGECALFRGLSAEDVPEYETVLRDVCRAISNGQQVDVSQYSSIMFGLETALYDFSNGCKREYYKSPFIYGKMPIRINGLVWMGSKAEMLTRIKEKIDAGFKTIKLKVGASDFEEEVEMIAAIRKEHPASEIEIRLDANGGFSVDSVLEKLKRLSDFGIHSIEQPIKAGNWAEMARLCRESPIHIALDEELIGINDYLTMNELLRSVHPQYIIIKPSLVGGISRSEDWLKMAAQYNIGGWVTSALESNIGLAAIAQWVATLMPLIPQGLGTGNLFTNNFATPLVQEKDYITYNPMLHFEIPGLKWIN